MRGAISVKVDDKGRLTIPREVREALGVEAGTLVFMQQDGAELRIAKAINPFDELAGVAVEEFRQGRTRSLREFAQENGLG